MFKRKSVNLAALLALGAISAPVLAQQAAPAQQLERVEITGSRIKTAGIETPSPIITLTAEAIRIEGRRDVEGLLNNLPQVFADQGGEVSNGSSGTANVNLRNLGSDRNLVLINGRRMPAGSPRNLAADLNQIPVSLIKRVEVLTGGASAVYGSDAISGVVNFIMNDRFEGVELDLNLQGYNHKQQSDAVASVVAGRARTNPAQFAVPGDKSFDGRSTDFSLTMGSNFANNKGNATLFVGRKQTQALLQSERDFTACSLGYTAATGAWSCGGSSTSFPGRFSDFSNYNLTVADAAGNVRNFAGATDQYNFGPTNYFQRPSNRTTAAAFMKYDVNDMARVYADLNFHDDSTIAQIAPSGFFLGPTVTMRYENPLLSNAWRNAFHAANVADGLGTFNKPGDTHDLLIGRRNVEGGGRQDDIRHTSYRGVLGVKGDLNSMFSYDAFVQSGKVVYQQTYKNDFSSSRSNRALDVVTDPATGKPVCRSVLDGTDLSCVPYNIWALGKVTPEALAYVSTPGFQKGFTSQTVAGASVSGDLTDMGVKSPLARGGLGFSVGFERRTEKMELSTDVAFTTGDLAGQGGPTIGVNGTYSVNEAFGEMRLPIFERMPMAELLNLTATYRQSKYSTGQSTNTYGLGLEYKPVKMATLRGSLQQATRAANIVELFTARGLGLFNGNDPCSGPVPTATASECARTGVTAAQYGKIEGSPANQYNLIGGGNPKLKPEEAKSLTFGLVLQPMRDLSVTIDYFKIKVEDTISTVAPTVTLQQCLTTGNPVFCSKVKRDSKGTLWLAGSFIEADNTNIGSLETEGIDIGLDYGIKLAGLGKLDMNMVGTYLKSFITEDLPGLAKYDCAGFFGDTCGTPLPVWRNKVRATWTTPWDLQLALTWRHIDKVKLDAGSSQSRLTDPAASAVNVPFMGARDYLDVAASYSLTKNVKISMSVNNLLDKDPPLGVTGPPFGNGNTFPVVYDAAGRRININLNARF